MPGNLSVIFLITLIIRTGIGKRITLISFFVRPNLIDILFSRIRKSSDGSLYWLLIIFNSNLYRLIVNTSQRHVSAEIHHYENGPIISASSREWGLKNQLYRFVHTKSLKGNESYFVLIYYSINLRVHRMIGKRNLGKFRN